MCTENQVFVKNVYKWAKQSELETYWLFYKE